MEYASRSKLCYGASCPADCGITRWPLERQCDSNNPFWPFPGGCDIYIAGNDDFSAGDINVMFRRYERSLGNNEAGDKLGAAMVTGDFDGDGYLDLAVGAPGEQRPVNGVQRSTGLVFLWRGTSQRLVAWKTVASPGPIEGGRFGAALAAGDLDGDGADELVVGAPGEHGSAGSTDGRVHIYHTVDTTEVGNHTVARRFGLGAMPWKTIDHMSIGLLAQGSEIGAALAIENFDGTGAADLAIGAPAGGLYGVAAGFVIVATGFGPGSTVQYRSLSQVGLSTERAGERFGASLAAASLGLTNTSSLIVGAPETGVGWIAPGRAYVFAGGSSMTPVQELAPATSTLNAFGSAVTVAYTNNGPAIAVGSPGEDSARGRVYVYRTSGLISPFPLALAQTLAHPTGTAVAGDRLGEVLAAVRVSGNTGDTLVAGVPRRDAPGATDSGAYLRFGSTSAGSTATLVAQGTIVDNPSPGAGKRFGSSVATAGAYDPTLGTFIERRVAVGSDGAEGGAGSFRVRNDAGGWDLFHQETAHPE